MIMPRPVQPCAVARSLPPAPRHNRSRTVDHNCIAAAPPAPACRSRSGCRSECRYPGNVRAWYVAPDRGRQRRTHNGFRRSGSKRRRQFVDGASERAHNAARLLDVGLSRIHAGKLQFECVGGGAADRAADHGADTGDRNERTEGSARDRERDLGERLQGRQCHLADGFEATTDAPDELAEELLHLIFILNREELHRELQLFLFGYFAAFERLIFELEFASPCGLTGWAFTAHRMHDRLHCWIEEAVRFRAIPEARALLSCCELFQDGE